MNERDKEKLITGSIMGSLSHNRQVGKPIYSADMKDFNMSFAIVLVLKPTFSLKIGND